MSQHILFKDDSDTEIDIKTDTEYAKSYNLWRKKEELHKLETKYGKDVLLNDDSATSSSDEDDENIEVPQDLEKNFFKTLSYLKTKNPDIYDEKVKFFDDTPIDPTCKKKQKEEKMFLKDYERKLLLEKGGIVDEEENDREVNNRSPTYVEQQRALKENLKKVLSDVDDDDDNNWGGMLKKREKTEKELEAEDTEYKQWLLGQKESLSDDRTESQLKPLKDYWTNPELDENEQFLRDYILNKRFLEKDDEDYVPTYDEVVQDVEENLSEDEKEIEEQEEFEHKYNFRFEEPDQDFIKRYPRLMENSVRRKDDRRKTKRAEIRERKQKEKEQKMEEIKELKRLKKKEIEEKIEKLRLVTGNEDLGFAVNDLDDDFDPDAHDKRMQDLFNDNYYEGPEEMEKPEFPELDEELEIEDWNNYDPNEDREVSNGVEEEAHCEDEDFNMDCDYDPHTTQNELIENSKGKKKRRRKSKFAKAVATEKPKYDPNDKTYEEYFEEYYKLDCEDIIGNIPCRFKYRKVVPNSFGLTIDEILNANDSDLNRWCSLRKAVQIRSDHIEKHDQIVYARKGQNEDLKRRLLPSLYVQDDQNDEADDENKGEVKAQVKKEIKVEENGTTTSEVSSNKKQKKRKRKGNTEIKNENPATDDNKAPVGFAQQSTQSEMAKPASEASSSGTDKKRKRRNRKVKTETNKDASGTTATTRSANKTNAAHQNGSGQGKRNRRKRKAATNIPTSSANTQNQGKMKTNNKRKHKATTSVQQPPKKMMKKEANAGISDARLEAFGIKPKKYKNKLKYGGQN